MEPKSENIGIRTPEGENNGKSYQKSYKHLGEYKCRIHGYHKRKECRVTCGFCGLRGSHYGKDCFKKNQIIREFVENKVQKYGIMAKSTAESLVTDYGIQKVTEKEFENIGGETPKQHKGGYEKCKNCKDNDKSKEIKVVHKILHDNHISDEIQSIYKFG